MSSISQSIAKELKVREQQVSAAMQLLDEGASVPFIARYRKEATGSLDDTQLRTLAELKAKLTALSDRRTVIIQSIDKQEKLTDELRTALEVATSQVELEDLYSPFKQKRRSKANVARESGLEPLAAALLENPQLNPETEAEKYIDVEKQVADIKAALEGARQILMEDFANQAQLVGQLRDYLWRHAKLQSKVLVGQEKKGEKFTDYFDYQESLKKVPSHRVLAILRGRQEGVLHLNLTLGEMEQKLNPCEAMIAKQFKIADQGRAADSWLMETVKRSWQIKIFTRLEIDCVGQLREQAEEKAIEVFADNLRSLLLAAPAGKHVTMGLDPGLRTGVKAAIVDQTGKVLDTATIYPHVPKKQVEQSLKTLAMLSAKHQVSLISIGNGTGSRETDRLVATLIKQHPELNLSKVIVSEAGASVYSASQLAANEFPDLDVTLRGAVSIARRLQDPLAELVKIEPKAIGVGQYQHDVNQTQMADRLTCVVEDCVNAVGVDLNTASVPLLTHVSGLNKTTAQNIVAFRDQIGELKNREVLKQVDRVGEQTYQLAAGFLRIVGGDQPLDSSAVHPEAYLIVNKILQHTGKTIEEVLGNKELLQQLDPNQFIDEKFGLPTVQDIIKELEKPGRDPRPDFKTAKFIEGVETINDLKIGMQLEGVATNVTDFGAFVDVGVHIDGLVHISELADSFVKDPKTVVKVGQVVNVKVIDIDVKRKRINLTMRQKEKPAAKEKPVNKPKNKKKPIPRKPAKPTRASEPSALSMALSDALKKAK